MKVLVIGASNNLSRVSYRAILLLRAQEFEVVAIGREEGRIGDVNILTDQPDLDDIDTITLYINPRIQKRYYNYLISLSPRRVIFNPGTENKELTKLLQHHGIKAEEACNLVLLSTGQF